MKEKKLELNVEGVGISWWGHSWRVGFLPPCSDFAAHGLRLRIIRQEVRGNDTTSQQDLATASLLLLPVHVAG
jgi:hypothetical protein